MKHRYPLLLAGMALSVWACCASAAVTQTIYDQGFDSPSLQVSDLTQWSFAGALAGAPVLLQTHPTPAGPSQTALSSTGFLGEFGGNDQIHLNLDLPQHVASVRLTFDAYLLRTWDGNDPTPIQNPRPGEPAALGGPDRFNFGYNGNRILDDQHDSFSNGAGTQTYCPGTTSPCEASWGSDANQKNRLGFNVELPPLGPHGNPYSLVYHFDTGPIPYDQSKIVLDFLSSGLQIHKVDIPATPVIDESWGLDNVKVFATFVPEPQTWAALLAGLLLSYCAIRRRGQLQR